MRNRVARAIARNDADLDAVQAELFETETEQHHERFRHVALARLRFVDPVTDVAILEWAALDVADVYLTGELSVVDEDAEAGAGAELPFAIAHAAATHECLAVTSNVGVPGERHGFPLGEPVAGTDAHLAPCIEIFCTQRPQRHTGTVQLERTSLCRRDATSWNPNRSAPPLR